MALTKRDIDAFRHDPNGKPAQILWDGSLPGFGVRVFASGAKSFILDYRFNGIKRRLTIGAYGELTPKQARDLAVQNLADVARGIDPLAARDAAREAARQAQMALTLREYADVYIERHAKPHKKSWKEDRRRLDREILPTLGSLKLADITRADVAALHARLARRTKHEANNVVRLLTVMRSSAIEWGYLPENTGSWSVKLFRFPSRDRWVTPDELPHLLAAIDAEESVHVRGALYIALLTGMRRGEVLGLRWTDVDLSRREIHLSDTKANRTHVVPLVAEAVDVLRGLPRMLGNPYVFPSPTKAGRPHHDMKRAWHRVRARLWLATHPDEERVLRVQAEADVAARSKHAGAHEGRDPVQDRLLDLAAAEGLKRGEALRRHDVRRTTGSLMAISGASLPQIGAILNHSNPTTTQIYARLIDDTRRAGLELVAQRVRAARTGA